MWNLKIISIHKKIINRSNPSLMIIANTINNNKLMFNNNCLMKYSNKKLKIKMLKLNLI